MDLGINLGNGLLNMKYKILQPKHMKITINETILTHFFNYVMGNRRGLLTDPNEYFVGELMDIHHAEIQNWKVQLIEDMIRGVLEIKDNE